VTKGKVDFGRHHAYLSAEEEEGMKFIAQANIPKRKTV
jgi:hypothetical protein